MARPTTTARRYAEAALDIARRDGSLDEWLAGLRLAADLIARPDVDRVADNPAIAFSARRDVLTGLLGPRVPRPVLNLVLLLAMRGRLAVLPAVASELKRLADRERGVVVANVTSAARLERVDVEAIAARLREETGADVEVVTTVDDALIGGLTVRIGDRLIDASVRGRLERLRDHLVAGAR